MFFVATVFLGRFTDISEEVLVSILEVTYVSSSLCPTFSNSGIILEVSLNHIAQAEEFVFPFTKAAGIRPVSVSNRNVTKQNLPRLQKMLQMLYFIINAILASH
jgi:hypothetical protein